MTSYPAFCDHILHQNELVAAGICHGDTWNLIFINNMLGEILKLSPGRMDDEPFLPRLTRCGFDEVEESLSEPHGGELIAHHKEGSMYIIRWKSVSIDDSAGGEQVRLITMSKIPVDQINRVAELPWQELTVLLDSIHDGIWVSDSDGITLRVNKAMERIAGLRAEEVIGKHVTEPMHKGRFETCVTLRALIEERSVTMFDDYSNGKRCLNTSTPIFDEKGNVWRVIASIRGMTELETLSASSPIWRWKPSPTKRALRTSRPKWTPVSSDTAPPCAACARKPPRPPAPKPSPSSSAKPEPARR